MKILIADDDPLSLRLLASVLGASSLEVITATDGQTAWQAIQAHAPDMIVLDWMMPGLSGLEICRRTRATEGHHRPYIVMVTQLDATDDVVTAFASGADDYVTKPYDAAELRARLWAGLRIVLRDAALLHETELLKGALARFHDLPDLVPICSHCKRVREQDTWMAVEEYVTRHTGIHFSHTYCPSCTANMA